MMILLSLPKNLSIANCVPPPPLEPRKGAREYTTTLESHSRSAFFRFSPSSLASLATLIGLVRPINGKDVHVMHYRAAHQTWLQTCVDLTHFYGPSQIDSIRRASVVSQLLLLLIRRAGGLPNRFYHPVYACAWVWRPLPEQFKGCPTCTCARRGSVASCSGLPTTAFLSLRPLSSFLFIPYHLSNTQMVIDKSKLIFEKMIQMVQEL